jgi:hypothetical protein
MYVPNICGNPAFPEMPGFSSIALAFVENVLCLIYLRLTSILGNCTPLKAELQKSKLTLPKLPNFNEINTWS